MEVRSVAKALRIIETLADASVPVGVSDLSRQLAIDKASVSRMLQTLERVGFVARDSDSQRYSLGIALVMIGQKALKRLDLRTAARPSLEFLAQTTGECAHISMLVADRAFYLDQIMPERGVSVDSPIGTLAPLYCTALGKILLAFQSEERREKMLSQINFESFTRRTITDLVTLAKQLEDVQQHGIAHDDEEFSVGIRCLAAPVFRHDGQLCGAIGISGPGPRMTDERLYEWEQIIRQEAGEVSARMGFDVKNTEYT